MKGTCRACRSCRACRGCSGGMILVGLVDEASSQKSGGLKYPEMSTPIPNPQVPATCL